MSLIDGIIGILLLYFVGRFHIYRWQIRKRLEFLANFTDIKEIVKLKQQVASLEKELSEIKKTLETIQKDLTNLDKLKKDK